MSEGRWFVDRIPMAAGANLAIEGEEAHHIGRVMRREPGDLIRIFDGSGREAAARILEVGKRSVNVQVESIEAISREPACRIRLVAALPRAGAADDLIRQAVEAGAAAIQPLLTSRGVHRPERRTEAERAERFRRLAISAMKQCRRNLMPVLLAPVEVADLRLDAGELGFFGAVSGASSPRAFERKHGGVPAAAAVVVGPEGGLSDLEEQALREHGFRALSLAPQILRVETAALALVTWLASATADEVIAVSE